MLERLQKIISRAGIASRRHAEQLILSGQVRVNGQVVTELGTKADAQQDRIEAAGKPVEANERRVYIVLNKPPEVISTLADPEGRKTLRNCLKGLPERVYPVGRLDYNASGLVFLTNDGDLAAEMLKDWSNLQQMYHVKIKGRLMMADLERLGRNAAATIRTVRQPDATRGHAENFWYEVSLQDSKKDILRRVLFAEKHPVEKLKRIGLGPLTLEGLPQGRYRLLVDKEVAELRRELKIKPKPRTPYVPIQESPAKSIKTLLHARPQRPVHPHSENRSQSLFADRPAHRKHGPRPSRPATIKDREGYPNQESPSDRTSADRPAKWAQHRRPARPGNRSDDRGPRRSGPPNKFAGPRSATNSGRPANSHKGKNPNKPFRPNRNRGPR